MTQALLIDASLVVDVFVLTSVMVIDVSCSGYLVRLIAIETIN